jgi:hypothetical protein
MSRVAFRTLRHSWGWVFRRVALVESRLSFPGLGVVLKVLVPGAHLGGGGGGGWVGGWVGGTLLNERS